MGWNPQTTGWRLAMEVEEEGCGVQGHNGTDEVPEHSRKA